MQVVDFLIQVASSDNFVFAKMWRLTETSQKYTILSQISPNLSPALGSLAGRGEVGALFLLPNLMGAIYLL